VCEFLRRGVDGSWSAVRAAGLSAHRTRADRTGRSFVIATFPELSAQRRAQRHCPCAWPLEAS